MFMRSVGWLIMPAAVACAAWGETSASANAGTFEQTRRISDNMVVLDGRTYPDPLVLSDGTPVSTTSQWLDARRSELLELFQDQVYGYLLPEPLDISYTTSEIYHETCTLKKVEISLTGEHGTASFLVRVFVPHGISEPVPAFLLIDNRGASSDDPSTPDDPDFFPVEQGIARGYAMAAFHHRDVARDEWKDTAGHFRTPMINLFYAPGDTLPQNAGRAVSAWAWGAMRVMDYFQTDPDIDESRVAVIGHSRCGKTALWAGAMDPRFAMVVGNGTGCTGARLNRRYTPGSETLDTINTFYPS
ncbi:MAG: hypothetical protein GF418_00595, partial [Chitinivibrionales bacterium]|nr:hypothetical protein [Chitinivibrionales bacterium]MBD3394098.1 hypothetical protein [Chitinivibrionales bacterium]